MSVPTSPPPNRQASTHSHYLSTARIPNLTPKEYREAISFHAKQTARNNPYPGQNFEDLDIFLQRPNNHRPIPSNTLCWPSTVATLYTLQDAAKTPILTANSAGIYRGINHLDTPSQLSQLLRSTGSGQSNSYVLFLAGYPTQDWLTTIGSLFKVDPEHYQRHLIFLSRQPYFTIPSLPSAAENIITLRFITIGRRHSSEISQHHIDRLRDDGAREMDFYQHDLKLGRGENIKSGDSIVRRYLVHDAAYFTIEQEISISLNYFEKQWVALILLDAGNDLSESLKGPWLVKDSHVDDRRGARWKTNFLPTIRHRPKLALKSKKYALPPEEHGRGEDLPQAASLLRRDYGKLLDWPVMKVDPFYALHELFEFAGASELQFLNLTEDKLGPETSCEVLANETPSLSNLLYTLEILQAQTRRLTENIEKIKCRGSSQWPHAADNTDLGKKAKEAADLLLRDYEFLLAKAQDLSRQCERSMSVIMYSANIVESKRAMEQANRVGKLTMLAYLYVPLSFTSSFFGMNFTQFSSGPYLSVWVWFAVSVPVMAFSILFYVWDIPALVSRSATWQRMKRHWRNMWR